MGKHCLWESTAIFFIRAPCQSCSFPTMERYHLLNGIFWQHFAAQPGCDNQRPTSAGSSIGAGGTHGGTPALDTRRVSAPGRPVRSPPHRFCVNMGGRLLVRSRAGRGHPRGAPFALVAMPRIELALTEGSHADH